ncbi:MAG: hypothetical protein LBT58_01370 [Endomicrobium sp.]|jgi:hypothetical protein|nr:hypothetical protein [Endomicrobium sp.]
MLNGVLVIKQHGISHYDGMPSIQELFDIVDKYKDKVSAIYSRGYKYALSNSDVKEVPIIGQ